MGLQADQYGWTMSDVLVTNQGLPPAQEAHMEFTTVIILRMWLFTATLLDQTLALVYQVQFHLASLFVSCLHLDSPVLFWLTKTKTKMHFSMA